MGLWLFLLGFFIPIMPEILPVSTSEVVDTFALKEPTQKARWDMKPTVRVCGSTEIPLFRIEKALSYWEMLGYDFDGVYVDQNPNCANPRYGEIVITLPEGDMQNHRLAATRLYTEKSTGYIMQAKIFVYPHYARKVRVLEHELGHALGWNHYPQKFHIMHPTWSLGGYDHRGLRK
jgi:hypothetical protein